MIRNISGPPTASQLASVAKSMVNGEEWHEVRSMRTAIQMLVLIGLALCGLLAGIANAGDVNRASCPNEQSPGFRATLPDCRAYEMVTPSYKEGLPVVVEEISEDGSELLARSLGSFSSPADTGGLGTNYQIERKSSGWTSTPLEVPVSESPSLSLMAMSNDFQKSLEFSSTPSLSDSENVYIGTPLAPFAQVGPGASINASERVLIFLGASRDLSHSVFFIPAPNPGEKSELWPGDRTSGGRQPSLYAYAGTGNLEPSLVGVSDEHKVLHIGESHLISECGTYLGGPGENTYNAISTNGTTVFFTALGRDYGECGRLNTSVVEPPVNELYARVDASRTVAISEPINADCGKCESLLSPADAEFQGASLDGAKVFFTTAQHLLPSADGTGADLYEYDFNGPPEERVTLVSDGDGAGARVQNVVRVSEDGTHVYFVAQGVLSTAANANGQRAEENAQNLYVYERDVAHPRGHVAFIATASVGTAQATPDGRFLVFESTTDLTPDQAGQVEAGQVFEYDAQTENMTRVSRGQGGYNGDGNTSIYPATIPKQTYRRDMPTSQFTGLTVSADGAYVYFTSEDGLVPQALSGVANIYEYHEGHVALISDGHDLVSVLEQPAVELLGTSESGQDVYFTTADRLLPQDADTQLDVYDARSEGGFAPASTRPSCLEDACQKSDVGVLTLSAPLTALSRGEGMTSTISGRFATAGPTATKPKAMARRKPGKKHRRKVKKAIRGRR